MAGRALGSRREGLGLDVGNVVGGEAVPSLAEAERRAVEAALSVAGNNIARAARVLGIDRGTLHRKVKKLGLGKAGR